MEIRHKKEWFKDIDGEKLKKYLNDNKVVKVDLAREAGINKSAIHDAIRRNETRIINMNAICDVLGVPRDYFDAPEIVEPEPIPEQTEDLEDKQPECLIDLADIQLSLNKIEALLLEQNRILRGKLEKVERTNEIKGHTNSGDPHSYTVNAVRDLR